MLYESPTGFICSLVSAVAEVMGHEIAFLSALQPVKVGGGSTVILASIAPNGLMTIVPLYKTEGGYIAGAL